ncbi:MAG: hypothetical protein KAW86_03775, partial [Bacteroidales bacterium]|nr:hypothetical protein [Bacteroidales bacterium]
HVNSSLTNILGYEREEMMKKEIVNFLVKNKKTEKNIRKLFEYYFKQICAYYKEIKIIIIKNH